LPTHNDPSEEFDLLRFFQCLPPVKQPSYRIYYDEEGHPTSYTVDDLPGNYIEVDVETYTDCNRNIRIVDGKIVKIKPPVHVAKLTPSDQGVPCDPDNVCIVVDIAEPHKKWSLKNRETY
jgi:hypothetical protein